MKQNKALKLIDEKIKLTEDQLQQFRISLDGLRISLDGLRELRATIAMAVERKPKVKGGAD